MIDKKMVKLVLFDLFKIVVIGLLVIATFGTVMNGVNIKANSKARNSQYIELRMLVKQNQLLLNQCRVVPVKSK